LFVFSHALFSVATDDERPHAHPLAATSPIGLPAPRCGLHSQLRSGLVLNYIHIKMVGMKNS